MLVESGITQAKSASTNNKDIYIGVIKQSDRLLTLVLPQGDWMKISPASPGVTADWHIQNTTTKVFETKNYQVMFCFFHAVELTMRGRELFHLLTLDLLDKRFALLLEFNTNHLVRILTNGNIMIKNALDANRKLTVKDLPDILFGLILASILIAYAMLKYIFPANLFIQKYTTGLYGALNGFILLIFLGILGVCRELRKK